MAMNINTLLLELLRKQGRTCLSPPGIDRPSGFTVASIRANIPRPPLRKHNWP